MFVFCKITFDNFVHIHAALFFEFVMKILGIEIDYVIFQLLTYSIILNIIFYFYQEKY